MTGDGLLATFDGPARAVACAAAITSGVRTLGLEVRAAVHTGEVELRDGDIGGIGVHIASRVMGLARPGEVLVSSTVKDLMAGAEVRLRIGGSIPYGECPASGTCSRRSPNRSCCDSDRRESSNGPGCCVDGHEVDRPVWRRNE